MQKKQKRKLKQKLREQNEDEEEEDQVDEDRDEDEEGEQEYQLLEEGPVVANYNVAISAFYHIAALGNGTTVCSFCNHLAVSWTLLMLTLTLTLHLQSMEHVCVNQLTVLQTSSA